MLFTTSVFWMFLALVLVLYRRLEHRNQNRLLLLASYLFYGWWDWRFLSLIGVSTLADFLVAQKIDNTPRTNTRRRRQLLAVSIVCNLSLLGVFKYFGFFAEQLIPLLSTIGLSVSLPLLKIALPVGISFYTFQTMSYTIDVARGDCPVERDLLNFSLFVCFFPQLVAGPIERAAHLLPQIQRPRTEDADDFRIGLDLIVNGLIRKVVIADNLGQYVDVVFRTPGNELHGLECLLALYAFAFQIYGDFSGYSCIAQGVARWLGFRLSDNFRNPYLAADPAEFWRRWHITLSQWLRDYVYIPLGGSRDGHARTVRNLLLTMLLGGLWHGAGWTFIAWGAFHGGLLCVGRLLIRPSADITATQSAACRPRILRLRVVHVLRVLLTFQLVCVGWLLFRSATLEQAINMWGAMLAGLHLTPLAQSGIGMLAVFAVPLLAMEIWSEVRGQPLAMPNLSGPVRGLIYGVSAIVLIIFLPTGRHDFLYFQF